jgi:hypothetical protein
MEQSPLLQAGSFQSCTRVSLSLVVDAAVKLTASRQVSAFTAASKYYTDIHKPEDQQLSSLARWIIGNATDDAYAFAAPVASASTTCRPGTMTATVTSNSSKYIQFDVQDSTCGTTSYIYQNLNSNITGTYSCMGHDGTSAYTVGPSLLDRESTILSHLEASGLLQLPSHLWSALPRGRVHLDSGLRRRDWNHVRPLALNDPSDRCSECRPTDIVMRM